jgi:hypothetical protein
MNLILSGTNCIYGLSAIREAQSPFDAAILALAMLSSMVYHLSEQKYGLPGIDPLKPYHCILLQVDRVFALTSAIMLLAIVFLDIGIRHMVFEQPITFVIAMSSLLFSLAGEITYKYNQSANAQVAVVALHALWHVGAFWTAGQILSMGSLSHVYIHVQRIIV